MNVRNDIYYEWNSILEEYEKTKEKGIFCLISLGLSENSKRFCFKE